MNPRVVQCRHAPYKAARRNWKVQYAGAEYTYRSWYRALRAARALALTVDMIPVTGLVGIQRARTQR